MTDQSRAIQSTASSSDSPIASDTTQQNIPSGEFQQQLVSANSKKRGRKDHARLHVMRHGVLSKYPLETLRRLGENVRSLRKLQQLFWKELEPRGVVGATIFDQFFSSYLRCLLAAKAEGEAFSAHSEFADSEPVEFSIRQGELPELVCTEREPIVANLSPKLLQSMLIVQKYHARFSGEMYRSLAILLLMRDGDSEALTSYISGLARLDK